MRCADPGALEKHPLIRHLNPLSTGRDPTHGVQLVYEDDAGRALARFGEQVPDARGAPANKQLHEFARAGRKEGHAGLPRHRFGCSQTCVSARPHLGGMVMQGVPQVMPPPWLAAVRQPPTRESATILACLLPLQTLQHLEPVCPQPCCCSHAPVLQGPMAHREAEVTYHMQASYRAGARARAPSSVLPVPGGPVSSTPEGVLALRRA